MGGYIAEQRGLSRHLRWTTGVFVLLAAVPFIVRAFAKRVPVVLSVPEAVEIPELCVQYEALLNLAEECGLDVQLFLDYQSLEMELVLINLEDNELYDTFEMSSIEQLPEAAEVLFGTLMINSR